MDFARDDVVSGALVVSEDAGGGDASEIDDNQQLLRKILEKLTYVEAYVKSTGVVPGRGGAHAVGVQQHGSMLAFTYAESDGTGAAQPEPQAGEPHQLQAGAISLLGEADRTLGAEDAVVRQGQQARADARERTVQESLAAREHSVMAALAAQSLDAEELFVPESLAARGHSVTAALEAQSLDAEELFVPVTGQPNDEKKKKKKKEKQAVVPARCGEADPQPMDCGIPPFGASQRLMWTVCILSMFVCVAGALQGIGGLHSAGSMPAEVAAELFMDGHGRVWYYPEPVEVTFWMHEIDGWELRLREAVDMLTAGTYEDNAAGFGDEDEYVD
eukprot:gene14792-17483_t